MILAWLASAFVAGVVLGSWIAMPVLPVAILAVLCAGAAYLRRRRAGWVPAAVLAALLLGTARASGGDSPAGPGDLSYYNGRTVQVTGVVSEEPDVRDTGANYVIDARQATVARRVRPVAGRLELHLPLSQPLAYGDAVILTGTLRTPSNHGGTAFRDILARRGIRSTMSFVRVRNQGSSDTGIAGWLVSLRQAIERNIDSWLPEPEASLLIAITVGARSASLGDLAPAFVATGLIHIVAISGIKVAMVAGTMYELARLFRRRLLTLTLALLALWLYVALTGLTVSGVRSAIMWTLVYFSVSLGRGTVALVSLAVAAAVMVGFEPDLPGDIGFQMSTLGTFSIVALTSPLNRWFRRVPSPLRESLSVTVAAQIGTIPVVLIGFGVVSATGPVANAVVLPLLPLLIVLGFAVGAVGSFPVLSVPLAGVTSSLLHFVLVVALWLSKVPALHWNGPLGDVAVVTYYAALAVASAWFLRRSNWAPLTHWPSRGRELVFAGSLGLTILTASAATAMIVRPAQLVWLGSGEAILLTTPHRTVLVDGSPHPQALLRALGSQLSGGSRLLDAVILTDPRGSNVTGLRAVLGRYTVREVLDVGAEYPSVTYAAWREDLKARHVPLTALRTGVSMRVQGVNVAAVGPDDVCSVPVNCVGLLRLRIGTHEVLLAGASSAREQREALFRPVHVSADTLVFTTTMNHDSLFIRRAVPSAAHVVALPASISLSRSVDVGPRIIAHE
jgi:competence protein ComEC